MTEREKIVKGLQLCSRPEGMTLGCLLDCPYDHEHGCKRRLMLDAIALLKAQEPRLMNAAEVADCPDGMVLWVEERQGVTWNLFPLEIEFSSTHPDTGTDYLFFITYHDCRKFECSEYNQTWRCWTARPTKEQMEAMKWE